MIRGSLLVLLLGASFLGVSFLGGCGPKPDVVRTVKATELVTEEEVRPDDPPPPEGWRTGQTSEAGPSRAPTEAWSLVLGGPVEGNVLTDGQRFFVAAAGELLCLTSAGKRAWRAHVEVVGMDVADGVLAAVAKDGSLYTFDAALGTARPKVAGAGPGRGRPVRLGSGWAWASGNTVMLAGVGTAGAAPGDGGEAGPLPAGVSREGAAFGLGGTAYPMEGGAITGIAADGATLFATSDIGVVSAFDTASSGAASGAASGTGVTTWTTRLGRPAPQGLAVGKDRIFVPFGPADGQAGGVARLTRDGRELWRTPTDLGPGAPASIGRTGPDAAGGLVYLADRDSHVYAFDPDSGEIRWKIEGFGAFTTQPVLAGSSAWVGSSDGKLYRVDTADGGVAWTIPLGAAVTATPAVAGGTLVVGLANGRVVGVVEGD